MNLPNYARTMHVISKFSFLIPNRMLSEQTSKFERVFSFPTIRYIALINRLKVYQTIGTAVIVPSCGLLELSDIVAPYTFLTSAYIGVTGLAVLFSASFPFRNIIGHLYISDDNQEIKISSVNIWGERVDRIVTTEDWLPLNDLNPRTLDAIYLQPQLRDGTKYKLFVKFGKVLNAKKMGHVLE